MLKIIIDNREQMPFAFKGYDCEIVKGTLQSGDYSLDGFADCIAIERKNPDDFLGCLTKERDRFKRELERLRAFEAAAIVIECPENYLIHGDHRSKVLPDSIEQSIRSWEINYRLPFVFAMSRTQAERATFDLLRHYYRHAEARYKAIEEMRNAKGKTDNLDHSK